MLDEHTSIESLEGYTIGSALLYFLNEKEKNAKELAEN